MSYSRYIVTATIICFVSYIRSHKVCRTRCSPSISSMWTYRRNERYNHDHGNYSKSIPQFNICFFLHQIDHFIQAIEMNPAVVSLKGYGNVNRELLTAAITTIAIYLIVLLQFKLSLIAQQLPPSLMTLVAEQKIALSGM